MKIAFIPLSFESLSTGWQTYGCLYIINIIEYLNYFIICYIIINNLTFKYIKRYFTRVYWMGLMKRRVPSLYAERLVSRPRHKTDQKIYKWVRKGYYFIDLIYVKVHVIILIQENSISIKNFVV